MTLRSDDFVSVCQFRHPATVQFCASSLWHYKVLIAHASLLLLFRGRRVLLRLLPPNVDRGSVEAVLEVGSVVFLDHLNAGAAVLRDLTVCRSLTAQV